MFEFSKRRLLANGRLFSWFKELSVIGNYIILNDHTAHILANRSILLPYTYIYHPTLWPVSIFSKVSACLRCESNN